MFRITASRFGWLFGVCMACGSIGDPEGGAGGDGGGGGSGAGSGGKSAGNGGQSTGGGAGSGGNTSGAGGTGGAPLPTGSCAVTSDRVRITDVDVGGSVVNDEDEVALNPLTLSPRPSGGSRLAWMGNDGMVHVTELDANDQPTGSALALPANDFADLHADDSGGVLLLTRDATGGGTLNCGEPSNLCGTPPSPPIPCYDMYLVRFDGGSETWATKLTEASSSLPPYSTGPTGDNVVFIWWYAHHGRIAFDGSRYAGYFGAAISTSEGGCINIHQGDRMQVVGSDGSLQDGGFGFGCSHSGYERVIWDPQASEFVAVCKTDNNNRIAFPAPYRTIRDVDLWYSNLGDLALASGGGYWLTTSDIRPGQPANADGLADVHLLQFTDGEAEQDIVLASEDGLNLRAPHLAQYGQNQLIAAWESSSEPGDLQRNDERQLYVQAVDRATGAGSGAALPVDVPGNRYQEFVGFPDGSVAFAAPGSNQTSVRVLRILPCAD